MIHFEKPIKEYFNNEITYMTSACFQKMDIQLGDILESIAPLYSTKDPKAWNEVIKFHLKDPTIDKNMIFVGVRIFTFTLDEEQRTAKFCKSYANTAYNEQMTVMIT